MGYMKAIFTDIQQGLEERDFAAVIETLNNTTESEDYKKELLFGTVGLLAQWQGKETTPRQDHGVTLESYLEELTDNNWHTLRELIELERNLLPIDREEAVSNALEVAIAYMTWDRFYKQDGTTLFQVITDRLGI